MFHRLAISLCLLCLAAVAPLAQTAAERPGAGTAPPLLGYAVIGRPQALSPVDIREIEISESGGITDVFVRLQGNAVGTLADLTGRAVGMPMVVRICGTPMLETTVQVPVTSGTFYIPNTTALQAEAMRAIWHGRSSCTDYAPEVFPIAQ